MTNILIILIIGNFVNLKSNYIYSEKLKRRYIRLEKYISFDKSSYKNYKKFIDFSLGENEFLVDTTIFYFPTPSYQSTPSFAFDGENYLVVWEDWRRDIDIYGARVSKNGVVIDLCGIPISTISGNQFAPAVAFDGENYLVVWEDYRFSFYGDIYGTFIDKNGIVLDTIGFPICEALNDQWFPVVSFDGENYLVVWEDWRNDNGDIYGARITKDGTVLDPNGFPIYQGENIDVAPAIVFGNNYYLIAWTTWIGQDTSDVYGILVNREGQVIHNRITICAENSFQYSPALSFDGNNYFVCWTDHRNGDFSDIYGKRIKEDGTILDTFDICITKANSNQRLPAIAFDGMNYFIIWEDLRNGVETDIYGAIVNRNGLVIDSFMLVSADGNQWLPKIIFDGNNYFAIWEDLRNNDISDIYGIKISGKNKLNLQEILITISANEQYQPAVIFDGENYLVVWEEEREGEKNIYGIKIDEEGKQIWEKPIVVTAAFNNQILPKISFDGDNYLVVWEDYRNNNADIYGARITKEGILLDTIGIPISFGTKDEKNPCVSFDGDNYLVVWEDYRNNNADIYGARIDRNGRVLDVNGIPICTVKGNQLFPRISYGDNSYFVVWQDERKGHWDEIYGARIKRNGEVIDTFGILIATGFYWRYKPSLAFDGNNYLVVYQLWKGNHFDIYSSQVSKDGILIDSSPKPIAVLPGDQMNCEIIFDGDNYLVVWEDYRNNFGDIFGAKINLQNSVLAIFPIANYQKWDITPSLVKGDAKILVCYVGWGGNKYLTMRIFGKFYNPTTLFPNLGWSKKPDIPSTKPVRSGGSLTCINDKVYAIVGNNCNELWVYNIKEELWQKKSEIPLRKINRSVLISDKYYLYILTSEKFLQYTPLKDTYKELKYPFLNKKIKWPSITYDGDSLFYLIPGSGNDEWLVYNKNWDSWFIPNPPKLPNKKWKSGSFIIYAQGNIYGLRVGGRDNEFYKLDLKNFESLFRRVADLPLFNREMRKKKAKKGCCATFDGLFIYTLKGNNTNEFYYYDLERDIWHQIEDFGYPTGKLNKKVKDGAALTYSSFVGGIFAFLGNKTKEFWFYNPSPNSFMKEKKNNISGVLISKNKKIENIILKRGNIKIYSITGGLLMREVNKLKMGVYFVKNEDGKVRKVVVLK
ncbi:MAG: hypothetical protein ABIK76_00760 [candidate division WOR-3 bacterium]